MSDPQDLYNTGYGEQELLRWLGKKALRWWTIFVITGGLSWLFWKVQANTMFLALAPLVVWSVISSMFWTRQYRELEQAIKPPGQQAPPA